MIVIPLFMLYAVINNSIQQEGNMQNGLRILLAFVFLLNQGIAIASNDKAFWLAVNQYGDAKTSHERTIIEDKIWSDYGKKTAVVVIDTSGFTLRSIDRGILSTLVVIQELRKTITQIMKHTPHGAIIKYEADNAFLRFDTPQDALDTIKRIKTVWEKSSINLNDTHPIQLSIGVGYGKILILSDDAYSEILNITSKLGEDTANANEVLLTEDAYKALKEPLPAEEKTTIVSNMRIRYYKMKTY